jgi:hypothetical protein
MSYEEAFAEMESRMKWLESAFGNFVSSVALAENLDDVRMLAGVAHNELRNLDMPEEWAA